jgi:4-hydroxythreonine-4-phosphate dehydrogenase
MKRIAISIGDLNGVGIELALSSHNIIKKLCKPTYCINNNMLEKAAKLLHVKIPKDFSLSEVDGDFEIDPGNVCASSGIYSYNSFVKAIELADRIEVDAITTMPINKYAWQKAKLKYHGHTDMLRDYFKKDAIMMLGCEDMYVALFTEHIPLKDVPLHVNIDELSRFFVDLHKSIGFHNIAVLGLNPHAGDNGVLGDEEKIILEAINAVNHVIGEELFIGPMVPDVAFTPNVRKNFKYYIAMYHDQGLAPLKALYFDESINVSLNLPIIRTSVDHGTAFDIAYKKRAHNLSYINAIKAAIDLAKD